jgi:hypothetical protein
MCKQTRNKTNGTVPVELTAWRRLRDKANKHPEIRDALVKHAILGGIAPSILKGLGEDL